MALPIQWNILGDFSFIEKFVLGLGLLMSGVFYAFCPAETSDKIYRIFFTYMDLSQLFESQKIYLNDPMQFFKFLMISCVSACVSLLILRWVNAEDYKEIDMEKVRHDEMKIIEKVERELAKERERIRMKVMNDLKEIEDASQLQMNEMILKKFFSVPFGNGEQIRIRSKDFENLSKICMKKNRGRGGNRCRSGGVGPEVDNLNGTDEFFDWLDESDEIVESIIVPHNSNGHLSQEEYSEGEDGEENNAENGHKELNTSPDRPLHPELLLDFSNLGDDSDFEYKLEDESEIHLITSVTSTEFSPNEESHRCSSKSTPAKS